MSSRKFACIRSLLHTLIFAASFASTGAHAYTSSGTDGAFQPTTSIILNAQQQIYNFTSIFIPTGVNVSFSSLSSAQPIEFLATDNITIAGTLDLGGNNLWIETPGTFTLSGALDLENANLTIVAGSINLTGTINIGGNNLQAVNPPSTTSWGGTLTMGSNPTVGTISNYPSQILPSGGGTLSGGPSSTISIATVPEPESSTLLILGLIGLTLVLQWRRRVSTF